ncbi:MAG: hypothetical protein CBD11_01050 [Phycisphaera sp. TMED151]|nr:MAG: hypothetical protein CBD11_01050 [Phycisphaera sp. TMED151]
MMMMMMMMMMIMMILQCIMIYPHIFPRHILFIPKEIIQIGLVYLILSCIHIMRINPIQFKYIHPY